jgi:PelA/Pel-15E family pectate lyase
MTQKVTIRSLIILFLIILSVDGFSQSFTSKVYTPIRLESFESSAHHWYFIRDKSNIINPLPNTPKYQPEEITKIADNILLFQRNNGGWPKNYDMQAILTREQADSVRKTKKVLHTTFDNSNTYTQIEYLAHVYNQTHLTKYKKACLKGIQFCLDAQYPNGGWPQYFPIEPKDYSRHITYNDGAYIGVLTLIQKIAAKDTLYSFVPEKMRKQSQTAYNRGIDCILNSQINENGILTVWCQQHDEVTLQPVWARAFEPPAICNSESVPIVLFLMKLKKPNERVIRAIQSAVKWFDESKILYTRVETVKASTENTKYTTISTDKRVVTDSTAAPIWTRYYELGTHRPLFCDRDSKFLYSFSEVSRERRVGYGWYTYEPEKVLKKYPAWQKKWAANENVLK